MKLKLTSYLFLLASLFMAQHTYAQRIKGVVIGGANITQVDGDEIYGFNKVGLNMGLAAIMPFGKGFSVSIETLYSQKGANQKDQYKTEDSLGNILTGAYKLQLNYLEVPILFHYTDQDRITIGGGFSYSGLVSLKEYEHNQRVETTTLTSGVYSNSDISVVADLRFRLYKRLKFNIRYSYSMIKIRTREFDDFLGNTWERDQYNNVFTLRLYYVFNERQKTVPNE
ncbi:MAG: PorT family protein [Chlorobi bacterium]|nr:PorT family protein [Chlorobiota bacterium]